MTAQIPNSVNAPVSSVAQQYGVPPGIWQDVAFVESGYNPTAIGDNGSSFGLFQLHLGGQADTALSQGFTTQDLLDPTVNAKFAMPSIARAWSNLKSTFNPNDINWWEQFAAQSGHPGGSPGNTVTDATAIKLQSNYLNLPPIGGPVEGIVPPPDVVTQVSDIPGQVVAQIGSAVNGAITAVTQDAVGAFVRVGLFIVVLVVLAIGMYLLVEANG